MILDGIAGLLLGIIKGVLALFPAWVMPASLSSYGDDLGHALAGIDGAFPVATLGICLGLMVGARIFIAAVQMIILVYTLIPFKFS